MSRVTFWVFFLLGMVMSLGVYAQSPSHEDSVSGDAQLTKTVEVSRAYAPTLPVPEKAPQVPELVDTVRVERMEHDYHLVSHPVYSDVLVRPIGMARLGREEEIKHRRFYVRLGFGDYISPEGVLLYSRKVNDKLSVGASLEHRSAWGKLKLWDGVREKAAYSRSLVGLQLEGVVGKVKMGGSVGYGNHYSTYYGRDTSVHFTLNPYYGKHSVAHRGKVNFHLQRVKDEGKERWRGWDYHGNLSLHTYSDNWKQREQYFSVGGGASHGVGSSYFVGGDVSLAHWARQLTPRVGGQTLFTLSPWGEWVGMRWRVRGGLRLVGGKNYGKGVFGIYPKAYLSYEAVRDYVVPFLEVDGLMKGNGYATLREQNSWLRPGVGAWGSSRWFDVRIGLGGVVHGVGLSYRGWLGFALEDSAVLFVNDVAEALDTAGRWNPYWQSTFSLEQARVQELRAHVELDYHLRDLWCVGMSFDYWHYQREGGDVVWHRPRFRGVAHGEFNLREKIVVGLAFYLEGGAWARALDGSALPLNVLYDLSIYGRYGIVDWLGIYAELCNVIVSRYEPYHLYPQHGFNMHMGVYFRF